MNTDDAARMRGLPSVGVILESAEALQSVERFGRAAATAAIRLAVSDARQTLRDQASNTPTITELARRASAILEAEAQPSLRPLLNLTGTVLHTNLGRAILADAAIEAAVIAMRETVALEYDVARGARGERDDHLRALLCELTGAEDATVVNNNAAAVLLCLNTLAAGREAIVSRGELIEIGGAFRMPDIMARAGTHMVEVGTTNRTHLRDYRAAMNAQTGLILKVHTSNFRIQGFTAEVGLQNLSALADEAGVPLMNDLGSGTLVDLSAYGLPREPTVRDAISEGAGLVTFSGDKLLGGPQAGFIVGRRGLVDAINRNPMKRALRVDKIRLAAIEATLKLYRAPDLLAEQLPTLNFLARSRAEIEAQASRLCPAVALAIGSAFAVVPCVCDSQVGSGAQPLEVIPSAGLAISALSGSGAALDRLASAMRGLNSPIIGRISAGSLLLDLRCLVDEQGFLDALAELPVGLSA
jgi:L-seryl-tRNA(Ser) seleniumtransferase